MVHELELRLAPAVAYQELRLLGELSTRLGIDANRINDVVVTRRSIDARQRQVVVNLNVRVYVDEPKPQPGPRRAHQLAPLPQGAPTAIVVGAGPAGLFAALRLIERGVRPVVLERGKDVDRRRLDMAALCREGKVDPDSNYCFGEGGAGAFSDGKLYTRSKKRGDVEGVLKTFRDHGADDDILVDAHPHIGTDRLPEIIKAMRQTIVNAGGEVRFDTRVTGLDTRHGRVEGVTTADGKTIDGAGVILATGHSARDVYRWLRQTGVKLEPKGLAVGVRLEHPQELIDRIRYHNPGGRGKFLPPAEYTMLTRVDGRAVYSFCMCPGGVVIPAASGPDQLAVNGMSPSSRGTRWANAGMVVEVLPDDVPDQGDDDVLKMMRMQESIEKAFFDEAGHTQNAPAQRMDDFVNERPSRNLPDRTSYAPGVHPARVDNLLPAAVSRRLKEAFKEFGRKNRGFLTNQAVVIGAETRTSSPVRVPRHPDTLQHVELPGLYPCGEGAGYAGGIVSAAIDGQRAADALAAQLRPGN